MKTCRAGDSPCVPFPRPGVFPYILRIIPDEFPHLACIFCVFGVVYPLNSLSVRFMPVSFPPWSFHVCNFHLISLSNPLNVRAVLASLHLHFCFRFMWFPFQFCGMSASIQFAFQLASVPPWSDVANLSAQFPGFPCGSVRRDVANLIWAPFLSRLNLNSMSLCERVASNYQ